MEQETDPRPGYAKVAATVVLVLLAGGTAYTMAANGGADVARDTEDAAAPSEADAGDDVDVDETSVPADPGDEDVERIHGDNQDLSGHGSVTLIVDCPGGKVAVSGGTWSNYPDVRVVWAHVADADTYAAGFSNPTKELRRVSVHVDCVDG